MFLPPQHPFEKTCGGIPYTMPRFYAQHLLASRCGLEGAAPSGFTQSPAVADRAFDIKLKASVALKLLSAIERKIHVALQDRGCAT